jgi:tetratricopeptide (TPR) repeat protein
LDWNATTALTTEDDKQTLLIEAEQEAVRALQLDNQNVLAQAFYAEILVDQQKWTQAEQIIVQAVERDPSSMDVHRVYAYVLEYMSDYTQAIEEYKKALEISPNLTFLYVSIGYNYRRLAFGITDERDPRRKELYDQAIEYFAKAANLNTQLGINDTLPYIAIAKAYSQQGEFLAASLNILKAMEFDPTNPDLYGQLGIIYFQARNYESSIPALKCALRGCDPETSCQARYIRSCKEGEGVTIIGLPLSPSTLAYYLTYGSVLSALSRPEQNYCPEAMDIFGEIRQGGYADDAIVATNVSAGEEICRSLEQSLLETPAPLSTPTLIPTPKQ